MSWLGSSVSNLLAIYSAAVVAIMTAWHLAVWHVIHEFGLSAMCMIVPHAYYFFSACYIII